LVRTHLLKKPVQLLQRSAGVFYNMLATLVNLRLPMLMAGIGFSGLRNSLRESVASIKRLQESS
jgi:hypothetical protein